jgi:hypothetical protein
LPKNRAEKRVTDLAAYPRHCTGLPSTSVRRFTSALLRIVDDVVKELITGYRFSFRNFARMQTTQNSNSSSSSSTVNCSTRLKKQATQNQHPFRSRLYPLALAGQDILGIAQTGTGKTAAYTLPLLMRIKYRPGRQHPRALIMAPYP